MTEEEAKAWVHEIEQLNQRLVKERDEARQDFRDVIGKTDRATMDYYHRYRTWLNEQPTVDEKGEGAVL